MHEKEIEFSREIEGTYNIFMGVFVVMELGFSIEQNGWMTGPELCRAGIIHAGRVQG